MRVLVTGGAGYIGSVISRILLEQGDHVRVLDDLSTGHEDAIAEEAEFRFGSILNPDDLEPALEGVDAVIHCAGKSLVGESVDKPDLYYQVNVEGTHSLIEAMNLNGVRRIVFSSSAAVYASGDGMPLTESAPEEPLNPYGATKLAVDHMLMESGLNGASFRYFNVAGAHFDGVKWVGERHDTETHLIPLVLKATEQEPLRIFGVDWPTADGTCVRDYIHVVDLARAHVAALHHEGFAIANLGTGRGSSVREVISVAEEVLNRTVPYVIEQRRAGDPAVLVASYEKANRLFQFSPARSLREMISDASQLL